MKKVLLVMRRKVLADALMQEFKNDHDLILITEYNYHNTEVSADIFEPDIILLELPESGELEVEKWFGLCERLTAAHMGCKVIFLCPEESAAACDMTLKSVREHAASDFVYYDTSMKYLVDKLRSM